MQIVRVTSAVMSVIDIIHINPVSPVDQISPWVGSILHDDAQRTFVEKYYPKIYHRTPYSSELRTNNANNRK